MKEDEQDPNLVVPTKETQKEVMRLWQDVVGHERSCGRKQNYDRSAQPQDANSGLVYREWRRTSRMGGTLTERTLEGDEVSARFIDKGGQSKEVTGRVIRTKAGQLVIESYAEGAIRQTAVPRDSSVDIRPRNCRLKKL